VEEDPGLVRLALTLGLLAGGEKPSGAAGKIVPEGQDFLAGHREQSAAHTAAELEASVGISETQVAHDTAGRELEDG
jgi:hypothetical protein